MVKDALLMIDGSDNSQLYDGHHIMNEINEVKAEEVVQLSNFERRLVEMVWQDDSFGIISLVKHSLDHDLDSSCSKDGCLNPGVTARLLQLACKLDSVKCAQILIEGQIGKIVNIDEMDSFGRSPLHTAAEMLSSKCLGLLLQYHARADLRSTDEDSHLALEIALASQRTHVNWSPKESVAELLVFLKDMDLSAITLLAEATTSLLEISCTMAVEGGVVELASLLMAADKLEGALENGLSATKNKTMYELVIEESLKLLEMAIGEQCLKLMQMIYEKRQALFCQIELLQLFGVASKISWRNNKDLALLLRASQAGDEMVMELLRKNSDVNDCNEDGNSSLHCYLKGSAISPNPSILHCLLKCGAIVYQHNKLGLTPVHLASLKGNYDSLQILLLHAPECVDVLSVTNETPLFFAVKSNSANCVKLLLDFGANRDALNLRRQRPIDLALSEEIRIILRTVHLKTICRNTPVQEDDTSCLSEEEHSDRVWKGFLDHKADKAEFSKKLDFDDINIKIEKCRYFHSPNGCVRGDKCYFSHGEEAFGLEKSRLLEHKPNLLRDKNLVNPQDDQQWKIFVGGLPPSVNSDDLKNVFEREFGPVEDATVIGTKVGSRVLSKGFGFMSFKREDSMKMAVKSQFVTLAGKIVEIKSALSKCQLESSSSCYDQELFNDMDEANSEISCCGDSNEQQALNVTEIPPWLVRFKKWLPAYLSKVCKRLGEEEWYPLSSLKGDFRATCGMELDHESLGYLKLSEFLRSLPGICTMNVISAGNGSPTHMVLRPFISSPCNQPQHSKHGSFHALSSSFSEVSDSTSFSNESISCFHMDGSMRRALNPVGWELTARLVSNSEILNDGFQEYNLWKGIGLFDQPCISEETRVEFGTQKPFSFFLHQWDSSMLLPQSCVICKTSLGDFFISPNLHKVCLSCSRKDDSYNKIKNHDCLGISQLQMPPGFFEEFPSLAEISSAKETNHEN